MISKSNSKCQRSRRKMREAKARLAAAQDAIKLGGTPWKFADFNLRPYAGKVEPSAVEGMKASTRPPAKKFTPNSVSNLRAEKRTHELRSSESRAL